MQAPGPFPVDMREALHDRIYGCDDCQEACPPNKALDRREPAPPAEADAEPWVPLLEVLAADDGDLLARFGRWYVPRRQPRYLRRNALVALGNVGRGDDAHVARALARALTDEDPLIRGHGAWAARRLGREDLVHHHLAGERSPEVLAEMAVPAAGPVSVT